MEKDLRAQSVVSKECSKKGDLLQDSNLHGWLKQLLYCNFKAMYINTDENNRGSNVSILGSSVLLAISERQNISPGGFISLEKIHSWAVAYLLELRTPGWLIQMHPSLWQSSLGAGLHGCWEEHRLNQRRKSAKSGLDTHILNWARMTLVDLPVCDY